MPFEASHFRSRFRISLPVELGIFPADIAKVFRIVSVAVEKPEGMKLPDRIVDVLVDRPAAFGSHEREGFPLFDDALIGFGSLGEVGSSFLGAFRPLPLSL